MSADDSTVSRRAHVSAVADGVHRFDVDGVNWYSVEDETGITVIDTGLPAHWEVLAGHLADSGRALDAVKAVLTTHAHPDHVGFAERLRRTGATVYAHRCDAPTVRTGVRVPLPKRFRRNLWRPRVIRMLITWVRRGLRPWANTTGGDVVPAVADVAAVDDADVLAVPGRPRVIHVPGHTAGSAAYLFPEHGVVFSGDALVTVDPVTGRPGVGPAPSGLNADDEQAIESLAKLEGLDVSAVLPGHGEPLRHDVAEAIQSARRRGTRW